MIFCVYAQFKCDIDAQISHKKLTLRKRVALCLGIAESALDYVLYESKRANAKLKCSINVTEPMDDITRFVILLLA